MPFFLGYPVFIFAISERLFFMAKARDFKNNLISVSIC
jgi:hypothetical protein